MKRLHLFLMIALVWLAKPFQTIQDVAAFLSTLPQEQALNAKVIFTAPRKGAGLGKNYVVFYQVEEASKK